MADYAIEPQRDVIARIDPAAAQQGATWFEACDEADATLWAVFDVREGIGAGPSLVSDHASRAEAEAAIAHLS